MKFFKGKRALSDSAPVESRKARYDRRWTATATSFCGSNENAEYISGTSGLIYCLQVYVNIADEL